MRASVSGTPQWLLKLFSAACTLPCAPSASAQHLLGAGLADRAGDRRPPARGTAPAPRAPSARSACEHVGHHQQRRVRRHALGPARDQRRGGAPAPAPRRRIVAVARGGERDEEIARPQACGCRSRRRRPSSRAVPRRAAVGRSPPRFARRRAGRGAAGVARTPGRSCAEPVERGHRDARLLEVVEGQHVLADRPGRSRGPCRRSAARRPAAARRPRSGSPRRGRRSRSPRARRRSTAARIAAGSSVRGLSSVTKTTSAAAAAAAPISGRLPRSRSPPAPKTTSSRPMTCGRSAVSAVVSASGVWA